MYRLSDVGADRLRSCLRGLEGTEDGKFSMATFARVDGFDVDLKDVLAAPLRMSCGCVVGYGVRQLAIEGRMPRLLGWISAEHWLLGETPDEAREFEIHEIESFLFAGAWWGTPYKSREWAMARLRYVIEHRTTPPEWVAIDSMYRTELAERLRPYLTKEA